VNLDISQQIAAMPAILCEAARIPTCVADRLRHSHALGIGALEIRHVECAGQSFAADIGGAVAKPLLVGESDDLDRKRQPRPAVAQPLHGGDGDHHSQRPVVPARTANGVEV